MRRTRHCVVPAPKSALAEVARRHGFSELGRFAVNYRSLFGESPSDTVRHRVGRSRSHHVAVFA